MVKPYCKNCATEAEWMISDLVLDVEYGACKAHLTELMPDSPVVRVVRLHVKQEPYPELVEKK